MDWTRIAPIILLITLIAPTASASKIDSLVLEKLSEPLAWQYSPQSLTQVPVIIEFREDLGFPGLKNSINVQGVSKERELGIVDAISGKLDSRAIVALENNPLIKRVHYDRTYYLDPFEDDGNQTQYTPDLQTSIGQIGATNPTFNGGSINGSGVIVAVIDTGIQTDHPDLSANLNLSASYDFFDDDSDPTDGHGHGTQTAGVVAARGGINGTAPGATIMALKVFSSAGSGATTSMIIRAIDHAIDNGAHVLSLSLGATPIPHNKDNIMAKTVEAASKNAVVVVSSGNNGDEIGDTGTPGTSAGAITVGAVDSSNSIASFSSNGPTSDGRIKPDIMAPGVLINTTTLSSGYIRNSGTSFSAPFVSGVAALVKHAHPTWTPEQIRRAILSNTDNISGDPHQIGNGLLNASAAINNLVSVDKTFLQFLDTSSINVTLTNNMSETRAYAVSFSNLTKVEGSSCTSKKIDSGNISLDNSSFSLTANTSRDIQVNVTVPNGVDSGIYDGYMYINSNNTIKVPIVLRITTTTSTIACMTNYCFSDGDYCTSRTANPGDWQFYRINVTQQYDSIQFNVSWTGSHDIDFFVYDPLKNLQSATTSSTTSPETITITDVLQGEYIIEVHPYTLASVPVTANINISYNSNSNVSTNVSWIDFGYVHKGNTSSIVSVNFTNTGAGDLTLTPSATAATELWDTSKTIGAGNVSASTFTITQSASNTSNFTIAIPSSTQEGEYRGNITLSYSGGAIELPYKVIVPVVNFTNTITSSSFTHDTVIPGICTNTDNPRKTYFELGNNINYTKINATWGISTNRMYFEIQDPSGNSKNMSVDSGGSSNISAIADSTGLWNIRTCRAASSGTSDTYSFTLQKVYTTLVNISNNSNYDNLNTSYGPGNTVHYQAFAFGENDEFLNFTANISVIAPNGTTVKSNTTIAINGSTFKENLALDSASKAGTWQIQVTPFNITAPATRTFEVSQNETTLNLSISNGSFQRLNDLVTVTVGLFDQTGDPISGIAISMNITKSGVQFNVNSSTTNSSGLVSFVYSPNETGAYSINVTSTNLENSSENFTAQNMTGLTVVTDKAFYTNGQTVYYNITLLQNTSEQMQTNETITVNISNTTGVVESINVTLVGNGSFNYTIESNITSTGTWNITMLSAFFSLQNVTTFTVNITYGVNISITDQQVHPNISLTVPINITNNGSLQNTFSINFTNTSDWNASLDTTSLTLNASQTATINLSMSVPFLEPGNFNNFTILVNSSEGDVNENVSFLVNVTEHHNISFSSVSNFTNFSLPLETNFTVNFTNTGNINETYTVTVETSSSSVNASVTPTSIVNLNYSNQTQFNVSVNFSLQTPTNTNITISVNSTSGSLNASLIVSATRPSISFINLAPTTTNITSTNYITNSANTSQLLINVTFQLNSSVDGLVNLSNFLVVQDSNGTPFWPDCAIGGIFGNITRSSDYNFYCTIITNNSWSQGTQTLSINVTNTRNHTGNYSDSVVIPRTVTVAVGDQTTASSAITVAGTAKYGSFNVWGSGTATGTGLNTCALTATNGTFSSACTLGSLASQSATATINGVWNTTGSDTFSITFNGTTTTTTTTGGGGGTGTTPSKKLTLVAKQGNSGETIKLAIPSTKIADLLVSAVEITLAQATSEGGRVVVENLETTKPTSVPTAPAKPSHTLTVYGYLDISLSNISSDKVASANINFQVLKSWLTSNSATKEQIKLNRYNNNAWQELNTRVMNETSTLVNFVATTPGFSVFAITKTEKSSAVNVTTTDNVSVSNETAQVPLIEDTAVADAENATMNVTDNVTGEPAAEGDIVPLGIDLVAASIVTALVVLIVWLIYTTAQLPDLFPKKSLANIGYKKPLKEYLSDTKNTVSTIKDFFTKGYEKEPRQTATPKVTYKNLQPIKDKKILFSTKQPTEKTEQAKLAVSTESKTSQEAPKPEPALKKVHYKTINGKLVRVEE